MNKNIVLMVLVVVNNNNSVKDACQIKLTWTKAEL